MKLYFYIIAIIISVTIKANYYYDSFNNKVEFENSKDYIAFIITKDKRKILETIIKENNYIIEERNYIDNINIFKISPKDLGNFKNDLIKSHIELLSLTDDKDPIIFPKEIYVKFNNNIYDPYSLKDKLNFDVIKYIKPVDLWLIRAKGDSLELSNKLIEEKLAINAQPDLIIAHQKYFIPNDPYFYGQWHLHNTGELGGITGADVKAVDAWDLERGSSDITIAIVDDGMNIKHPDLKDKIVDSYDFANSDNDVGNSNIEGDETGFHGTACAGVAAASGDNNIGVTGACPNCSIISGKIGLGEDGKKFSRVSADADAIIWSAGGELEGINKVKTPADIISNSWGFRVATTIPFYLKKAIDYAVTDGRDGKGCVVLFASGNENREFKDGELEAYENVISVGASTDRELRSTYSNYGKKLDLIAPSSGGVNEIWTTDYEGSLGYNDNGRGRWGMRELDSAGNYTSSFGGTSSATPLVAGIVGLILSKNNSLKWQDVRMILIESADQTGNLKYIDGRNDKYGYGRANAFIALKLADWDNFNDISKKCELQSDCNFNCLPKEIFWPEGYCSKECSANYCASDNLICAKVPKVEQPQCLTKCENNSSCREGYVCSNFNDEEETYCIPGCTATGCDKLLQICDKKLNLCVNDVENPCWDKENNKPKECQDKASCDSETGKCICEVGFVDNGQNICTPNLCIINGIDVVCRANSTCEGVTGLCLCNDGYNEVDGKCKSTSQSDCSYSNSSNSLYLFLFLFLLIFFRFFLKTQKR